MQIVRIGKNWRKYIGAAAICLLVAGVLLAVLNASAIRRQMDDWKLLPQPERLTELYFENHAKLPTTYIPDTPQNFGIITHNLEHETTEYSYSVVAQSEDGKTNLPLAEGKFSLPHDSINTSKVRVAPSDLGQRVKIVTTLTIKNAHNTSKQTIHYWVTKEAA